MCGWTLARGHARSGDRIAIASYLGVSDRFDQAHRRLRRDLRRPGREGLRQALLKAIKAGKIAAETGI